MTNNQPKINQLITELCPNGVEFKCIEELLIDKDILTVTAPKKLTKKYYQVEGKFPIVDQGQNFIVGYTNDSTSILNHDKYVIFGDHTEAIKYIDFSFAQGADGIKILKSNSNVLNIKYFYYAINNFYIRTGKYTRHFSFLKKTFIPIPPLQIQQEIVNILDKFTQLEAELEAELEARKKQYEYYKSELLETNDATTIALEDIAEYSKNRISAENLDEKSYIGVDNLLQDKKGRKDSNHVPTIGNSTQYEKDDILIGNIRPYLKKIWFSDRIGGTNGDVLVISLKQSEKENINPRFLYYLLSSDKFFEYNMQNAKGAKMPRGNKAAIMKYTFSIPSFEEQEKIVSILDKFDALVNDISIGLPAEIKARRQQYEHYRGKLLTFNELEK